MILGIDAFNIRAGGGLTHLKELLRAAVPKKHGFKRVVIWGCNETLAKIEERDWLLKVSDKSLERGLIHRALWQKFKLRNLAEKAGCSILFVPGGSDASGFKPKVTMSQNLLPFEWRELARYGWSLYTTKFLLLRWSQSRSFRNANGIIFLTEYARSTVVKVTGKLSGQSEIVPHGISPRFFNSPRPQRPFDTFSEGKPCKVLYVSIVDMYKHQWHVAEAVGLLRSQGIPIILELVGPPARGIARLEESLNRIDPNRDFVSYKGAIPYEKLDAIYADADIGVFASSCENMPNILLEGMAAGLPMACSEMGPMPEVLGEAGVYFNPENSNSIAAVLRHFIESPRLREQLAQLAFERAQGYTWIRCADETFGFLARIAKQTNPRGEF